MDKEHIKIYITSILMAWLIISPIALFQILFVYERFQPEFVMAPLLVGLVVGSLLGRIRVLSQSLTKRENLFHAIADEAKEFSYFKDTQGKYIYLSPAVYALTGYKKEDFFNENDLFSSLIIKEDQAIWEKHQRTIQTKQRDKEIEFRIRTKNHQVVWVSHNCSPIYEKGQIIGHRSVNSNINERKTAELEMYHMARFDSLTQLPNRKLVFESITKFIEMNKAFSILFLDLNRFKQVNDSFGHKVGDAILVQVANILKDTFRDTFTGRLGGDEFILLVESSKQKTIQSTIDKLLEELERDYKVEDLILYIGLSVGVASYPSDSRYKEDLLACADKAMYQAKRQTNTEFVYYKDLSENHKQNDFILEHDLREAIKNNELYLHFQPKINTKNRHIESYEALVRWRHDSVNIPPDTFIPIAERTGLIKYITQFVINEVFALSLLWKEQNLCHHCSINISVIDLMSDDLIVHIQRALKKHQVDPSWFEIEMTESLFLEETEAIKERLQKLIDLGFNLALDDFGTGYSSLSYLTKFPIQTLKIDKAFIQDLDSDYKRSYPLLKSIVSLAQDLNLNIVAEGVETQHELDILTELGCYTIQGYFFHKPLSIQHLEGLNQQA